jgi:hypothetical protein
MREGRRRPVRVLVLLLMAGLLVILACSSEDPTEPPPPPEGPTIKQVVESTGWFPAVSPDSNAWALARFDSTGGDGEPWACTSFDGAETRVLDVLTTLVFDEILHYPGAILQWTSLDGPTPLPVLADRAGGAIALSTPAGDLIEGTVAAVEADEVAAWRTQALAELGAVPPGPWQLAAGVVYNPEHLAVVAGLGPEGMTASAWERLEFHEEATGRVLLTLTRVHHTVSCPYPGSATEAFAAHVEGEDIQDQMAMGNPPVWVDSVDHGQLLHVLVEAEADPATVMAAAVNSFAAGAENRAPDAGAPLMHELPGLSLSVLALGADGDAAEVAFIAGQQQLTGFLQTDPGERSDLPGLTAALAALRNGGPVQRAVSAEFSFTSCEVFEPVLDQIYWAFSAADARTVWVDGDLSSDTGGRFRYDGGTSIYTQRLVESIPDLVGGGGNAVPPPGSRRPFFLAGALNGRPVVELFELALPDGFLFSELRFNGSALAGNDYTIFLVFGTPYAVRLTYTTTGGEQVVSQRNRVNWFLHGDGQGLRHNLMVGFPDDQFMVYEHTGYGLEIPRPQTTDWHVCVLRFGVNSGMTLFYDGEIPDGGDDAFDTFPLLEFSGATVGARWQGVAPPELATFWLAEIIAYRGAASDQLVLEETARLQQKYGLTP